MRPKSRRGTKTEKKGGAVTVLHFKNRRGAKDYRNHQDKYIRPVWGRFYETRLMYPYMGPYPDWELEIPEGVFTYDQLNLAYHNFRIHIRNKRQNRGTPVIIRVWTLGLKSVPKLIKFLESKSNGFKCTGRYKSELLQMQQRNNK